MLSPFDQRRVVAECLGSALLLAVVVGSGIMAQNLTGDTALALLANSLATGAALVVLITIFGPLSGAHFNPVVSMVALASGQLSARSATFYVAAQLIGAVVGVLIANAMFSLPVWQLSATSRTGSGLWLGEFVATFGLVVTILAGQRFASGSVAWLVGLYITSAYWFTSSTSFANPAVTLARSLTDTFAGISMADVPAFAAAQVAGGFAAVWIARWLLADVPASAAQRATTP